MKKVDTGIIDGYKQEIEQQHDGKPSNYYEIEIIHEKGNVDENVRLNMDFLGLDLSKVPSQNLTDYKVYIIPVLYVISSFLSMRITTRKKIKKNPKALGDGTETKAAEPDVSEQMTKSMSMITPIMAVSIAFIAPLGLAMYWFVSNLLMIIERIVIDKYVSSKEDVANV
jgi:YidC/Oxa1 family membrane protein insertase